MDKSYKFSKKDKRVLSDYSFLREQFFEVRDNLILMKTDSTSGVLSNILIDLIENLMVIADVMSDKKDYFIYWIKKNGFEFRSHDYHNKFCSIEIREDGWRLRNDNPYPNIKMKMGNKDKIGYYYGKGFNVSELERILIDWDLIENNAIGL